jgi:hypothetical protein
MQGLKVKIGDHYIQLIYESNKIKKLLEKYLKSYTDTARKQPDLVITITDGYGVSFQDYDVKISKNHGHILYRRADYLIAVNVEFKAATVSVYDELALKHALMNLYSSFIVHNNWGLLIHSSCVIENGKAHIFSGHSGAGKSTAAKLSYPRSLLSDEATLVKITPKNLQIFNSPFRSEIESDTFNGSIPLSSIQILNQALQNKREKIGKSDALFQLMDKVFYWPHNKEETSIILNLMAKLVKEVPVYQLYFQKNNTFWELIS